jgi:hypothetical protein
MRLQGVNPLCICLSDDEQSRKNLIRVYGDGAFIITQPEKLINDLSRAYVALTK